MFFKPILCCFQTGSISLNLKTKISQIRQRVPQLSFAKNPFSLIIWNTAAKIMIFFYVSKRFFCYIRGKKPYKYNQIKLKTQIIIQSKKNVK